MDWDFHIGLISLTVQVLQWHSLQIGTDRTESAEDDSCVFYVQSV